MPTTYTDVDRLILDRWEDTQGLLEAYEDLQDRMQDVLSDVGAPLERWASVHGYKSYADPKSASFGIYRPSWENRRRDDALVYFAVEECAPIGYRRVKAVHPGLWVYTDGLQATKMKEADRVRFASDLRAKLGPLAEEWRHPDALETEYPLLLGPRPPEAQDDAQIVFEKFRTGHLRPSLPKVHLRPVLEARRLYGGWRFQAGRLAPHPALDLLFADGRVAPQRLASGPDVPTALEPEVVVEDVTPFEHAHRLTNPFPRDRLMDPGGR